MSGKMKELGHTIMISFSREGAKLQSANLKWGSSKRNQTHLDQIKALKLTHLLIARINLDLDKKTYQLPASPKAGLFHPKTRIEKMAVFRAAISKIASRWNKIRAINQLDKLSILSDLTSVLYHHPKSPYQRS